MRTLMRHFCHIDTFSSADHLRGAARTYEAVKAAALEAGRFSCFEASDTPDSALLFRRLCHDPEIVTFVMPYPWTGVRRKKEPWDK